VPRRPTPAQRLVDRALGVSRRRRQLAYLAIGGGVAMLRPLLRRAAAATGLTVALLVAAAVF